METEKNEVLVFLEKLGELGCLNEEKDALPNRKVETPINQKDGNKRRVDDEIESDGFKDFNIYLDLENIKYEISQMQKLAVNENFFIDSMTKAVKTLQSLLRVKPLKSNYYIYDTDLAQLNITRWNKTLFGSQAYENGVFFNEQGIDLVIFGTFSDLGDSTLATASAKCFQPGDGQPYIGLVKINKNVDYTKPHSEEYFTSILVHEFTHILGFSKHFFETYYHNLFWEIDELGFNRTYLNSTKVLEVAKKYYNCPNLKGVELENQGGAGTASSHWEARILLGEYMNGYSYTEEQVISEFTLAVLEDSGYYKPNYYTGGLMRFGRHKGCEFLNQRCIDQSNHKTNENFENEFYDNITYGNNIDPSCTSGRQSRTYNAWYLAEEALPKVYQYFENEQIVGYEPADFCPVPLKYEEEEKKSYYVGHCSLKGSGEYGSQINYYYRDINPLSKFVSTFSGETFSDHSFCFLSSLVHKSKREEYYSYFVRSNCYEIFCSSQSLTVKILNDYIVCPRAGGKILVDGYHGYLMCPDYNLMCSGTVVCNDMFDCVEKKSEIKDSSYNYDYTIKTGQNIPKSKIAEADDTTNYELSEDGICPQYCHHCNEKKQCLKCKEGYGLTLGENETITCIDVNLLTSGYFQRDDNIYIKCMENCDVCLDTNTCDKCKVNYIYNDNDTCIEPPIGFTPIANCLQYTGVNLTHCKKCEYKHGFNRTNMEKCLDTTTDLHDYYTKNNINYYPCGAKIENCTKCHYDKEKSDIVCDECLTGLALLNRGDSTSCSEASKFENSTKYFKIDDNHYGKCSQFIEHCIACVDQNSCDLCEYMYEYINITKRCELKKKYSKNEEDEKNENDDYSTDSNIEKEVTKGRGKMRKGKKTNDSAVNIHSSLKYILLLQTIYILLLLIKF